jgi:hypothetical protein
MKIKGKERKAHVSFVPKAPGERGGSCCASFTFRWGNAQIIRSGNIASSVRRYTTSSPEVGGIRGTPGVHTSQRHPGSNKNMQPRGSLQRHDTRRDSPRSYFSIGIFGTKNAQMNSLERRHQGPHHVEYECKKALKVFCSFNDIVIFFILHIPIYPISWRIFFSSLKT